MSKNDYPLVLHPTWIELPPEIRVEVITLLNKTLACMGKSALPSQTSALECQGQKLYLVAYSVHDDCRRP